MFLLLCLAGAASSTASAQRVETAATVGECSRQQIALHSDGENGNFDGMNHGGTLLVFRNISTSACRLGPFMHISLDGADGKRLGVSVEPKPTFAVPVIDGHPLPMGHGPVVLPVTIPAGATATSELHWVSGLVYDRSVCVSAAGVSVDIGGVAAQTSIAAHICGPDATHISASATRLMLDPARG